MPSGTGIGMSPNASNARQGIKTHVSGARRIHCHCQVRTPPMPDRALRLREALLFRSENLPSERLQCPTGH